jgi:NADPH-dependent glutamate synthase beta subunit-like oxidoreductase
MLQALVSIGYKGVAIDGTEPWFDDSRGVMLSEHGRVDSATSSLGGLYVSGWLKRGPSGIIGTNITDAKDTVATILADLQGKEARPKDATLSGVLADRCKFVTWADYEKIDAAETSDNRKRSKDQPREKITNLDELLEIASS